MSRPILFLTDYGLDDEWVGVCHAVIAEIAPEARVIDLTHGIPPQDVTTGAVALVSATPYARDAVYLAVVDPGVGTERRAVAVEAGGAVLVGPDNGLLSLAVEGLGGAKRAVEISAEGPKRVSDTFHGRDVFAPAAAHLAAGAELESIGTPIDPRTLAGVGLSRPTVQPARIDTEVIGVDRYGNARLAAREDDLTEANLSAAMTLWLSVGGERAEVRRVRTFGEVPEGMYGLLVDSSGWLSVVRNLGSAAADLRLRRGTAVSLRGDAVG